MQTVQEEFEEEYAPPPIHWQGNKPVPQLRQPEPTTLIKPPSGVNGCELCEFGIVYAPKPIGALPFYVERRIQFDQGLIQFCTCRTGQLYKSYLVKASQKAREEKEP